MKYRFSVLHAVPAALLGLICLPELAAQHDATPCHLKYIRELPTDPCNDYRLYAPLVPEHTPVKTIRLVLHVVQQDAGLPPRNFEDNDTGRNWINAMLWQLNVIFRNLAPPSHSVPECPSEHIKHARIQFRTEGLFFHQSSRHWNQNPRSAGATWCNIWDDLAAHNPAVPEALRENALHVFIVYSTWSEHHTGFSPGIGDLHANFVVVGGYYKHLFDEENPDLDNAPYTAALTLAHEIGHACGLYHSEAGDFCCDTQTGPTNNLMHSKAASLTQCQLARMHYLLESGEHRTASGSGSTLWKTIATDYCAKDESRSIVIPAGETVVWAEVKKLTTDVVVEAGAQLIIRCRIGLPDGARIVVKRGARLVIDGGVVTHNKSMWPLCFGGEWEGILVDGTAREYAEGENLGAPSLPDPAGPGAVWLRGAVLEHARNGLRSVPK